MCNLIYYVCSMNKKLWVLLAATAFAASCDSQWQNSLEQTKEEITSQAFDTLSKKQNNDTINFVDVIEQWNIYDSLIQKVEAPIASWNLFKPEISITIDDWCGAKYTEQILDTLAKYNVKVTFFIPWTRIKMHAEQRRRALNEWHQICCHSYDHHYFRKSEPELLKKQILDWEQAVKDSIWEEYLIKMKRNFPFFRYPGWCWETIPEHVAVLKELWYLPIHWSDDTWQDWKSLNNGDIILFHVKPDDFLRISKCIQWAQAQELQCKKVSEIVDPNESDPIYIKDLWSKRKKAKEIMKQQKLDLKDKKN